MINEGRIYKYVVPERINILEDLQLRITQPKYLNDLFDLAISFKRLVRKETYEERMEGKVGKLLTKFYDNIYHKTNFNMNDELKKRGVKEGDLDNLFKLFFTEEHSELKNGLKDGINKSFGVLSFTESYDNVPMWAHYTNLYQGFVLILNSNHKFFNRGLIDDTQMGYLEQVKYVEKKKGWDSLEELHHNLKEIFFEKQDGWKNEKEWRMILPLEIANEKRYPDIFLIDIPSDLIIGVIFGFNCSNNLIEYVKELKEEELEHLELYKAIPNLDEYKMDIIKLNDK